MDEDKFKEAIGKIMAAYQARPRKGEPLVDPLAKNRWFDMAKHIPNVACDWIVESITRNSDGLPRNLGKALCDGWTSYKAEHPNKIAWSHGEKLECADCNGEGVLHAEKGGYVTAFVCPMCTNWTRVFAQGHGIQAKRRAELESMGYVVGTWGGKTRTADEPIPF